MGRKIIDIIPVIAVRPIEGPMLSMQGQAEHEAQFIVERLRGALGNAYDFTASFETEAQCEHCRHTWTEAGADYNGSCCARDSANDPDQLGVLRSLAAEVVGADLYPMENGRRGRVAVDWPWALASNVLTWLEAGRPAEAADFLRKLAERVDSREWVTVWEDPGDYPSNAGAGPLPDRVSAAPEPNELASDLVRLLDDMDLLPATKAVA